MKITQRLMLPLVAVAASLWTFPARAINVPPLTRPVEDFAHIYSPQEIEQLEAKIRQIKQTGRAQIQVLTLASLEGDAIENVSIQFADAWKLGRKGIDQGVLITIAPQEHKIRIEVGKGLEGEITDLVSSRIIRHQMAPAFRTNAYFDGTYIAIVAIDQRLNAGTSDPQSSQQYEGRRRTISPFFLFILMIILIIFRILRVFTGGIFGGRRHRSVFWGGGFGGGGGGWGGGSSWGGGGGGFSGGGASGNW